MYERIHFLNEQFFTYFIYIKPNHMDPIRFNIPAIVTTTLACLFLHTVIAVHEYRQSCDTNEEKDLKAKIKTTKDQISKVCIEVIRVLVPTKLSTVSDFVEVSKLQRLVGKYEKELELYKKQKNSNDSSSSSSSSSTNKSSSVLPLVLQKYGTQSFYVLFTALFWYTPIALIPTYALGPTAIFFSFPGWSKGTIGILPWLFLINQSIQSIVKYVRNKLGYIPPPPENFLTKLLNMGKSFTQSS